MKARSIIIGGLGLIALSGIASAQEEISLQALMAVSKMAGACGILDEMIHFQEITKMSGGDDFVARFWGAEAARLGLSMQQYSEQCDQALLAYGRFWEPSLILDGDNG